MIKTINAIFVVTIIWDSDYCARFWIEAYKKTLVKADR